MAWHSQTPGWVQNLSASAMESAMNNHIDKVMGHYAGDITVWDVVNEAFEENGSYRSSFWYNKMGKSFIEKAFIRARQADPKAKLIYNDYNLEATGSKSDAAYNMLKDFKSRGIPVDGIGFQMHLDIQYGFNYDNFAKNMQRFADLGLEIYVTEMDVRVSSNPSSSELQKQADYYKGVVQKCMAQPAVKAIQFWGFTDKYSWVPGTFSGRGAALLFDSNYNPKQAYYAVQSALNGYSTSTPPETATTTPIKTSISPTITPSETTTTTPIIIPITPTITPTTSTVTPTNTPTENVGVKYTISSDWGSGATISVTVTNKGTSDINGWKIQWNYSGNEKINNLWNGSLNQSGTTVNVSNANYNSLIPASGSVSFGFNIAYSGTTTKPTAFSLNGDPCIVE
jgi:hypothetical protein